MNHRAFAVSLASTAAFAIFVSVLACSHPSPKTPPTVSQVIENYRAETTIHFASSEAGGRSMGRIVVDRLEFERGGLDFGRGKIDLAGRERDFQALTTTFTAEPDGSGRSILKGNARADGTQGSGAGRFVGLQAAFSVQDLRQGDRFQGSGQLYEIDSSIIPELRGAGLAYRSTYIINNVDAANRTASASCSGSLTSDNIVTLAERPSPRSVRSAGVALMAIGLIGLGTMARRWRS